MYAIIMTGGKQYRVAEGDEIYVEKLEVQAGDTIRFEDVLAVGDGEALTAGSPYLAGSSVTGMVLKNGKGPKINVFTYRSKKGSARRLGHRQPYTKIQITAIKA